METGRFSIEKTVDQHSRRMVHSRTKSKTSPGTRIIVVMIQAHQWFNIDVSSETETSSKIQHGL